MLRRLLRSKIHRATITEADVDYLGSLSIDEELAEEAGLQEYEEVMIADLDSGERLWTYVILADRGSRTIGTNGAAAIKIPKGHRVIIFAFGLYDEAEALNHKPRLLFVDEGNNPISGPVTEKHAQVL